MISKNKKDSERTEENSSIQKKCFENLKKKTIKWLEEKKASKNLHKNEAILRELNRRLQEKDKQKKFLEN